MTNFPFNLVLLKIPYFYVSQQYHHYKEKQYDQVSFFFCDVHSAYLLIVSSTNVNLFVDISLNVRSFMVLQHANDAWCKWPCHFTLLIATTANFSYVYLNLIYYSIRRIIDMSTWSFSWLTFKTILWMFIWHALWWSDRIYYRRILRIIKSFIASVLLFISCNLVILMIFMEWCGAWWECSILINNPILLIFRWR